MWATPKSTMWGEGNGEIGKWGNGEGYLTVVVFGDENVLGLDITMHYFMKMDYSEKRGETIRYFSP